MSDTNGNGHDRATDPTVMQYLQQILTRIGNVEARIDSVEHNLSARIDALHEDVRDVQAAQATMQKELSSLRTELRVDLAEWEERQGARIDRLEAAVFEQTGT